MFRRGWEDGIRIDVKGVNNNMRNCIDSAWDNILENLKYAPKSTELFSY